MSGSNEYSAGGRLAGLEPSPACSARIALAAWRAAARFAIGRLLRDDVHAVREPAGSTPSRSVSST